MQIGYHCVWKAMIRCHVGSEQMPCTLAGSCNVVLTLMYSILQAESMLSFETLLKTRCSLRANKMAVLLSNDKHDDDTPIIEAVASDFMLSLSGQAARQQLSSQCGAKLGLDVYNNGLMGWEPLLEPWTSSLAVSMPLTR